MRIRKGDRVQVLPGKDRGKIGEVMRVIPTSDRVIVDGVNVAKRSTKTKRRTMQGGIIDKDMPVHVSTGARSSARSAGRRRYRLPGRRPGAQDQRVPEVWR